MEKHSFRERGQVTYGDEVIPVFGEGVAAGADHRWSGTARNDFLSNSVMDQRIVARRRQWRLKQVVFKVPLKAGDWD